MKTKDNKGITLISLIITIIIMLILVSVATGTGIETYKTSQVNKFVIQMQLLQSKIDDIIDASTIEELNNLPLQAVTTQEQIDAISNAFKQDEIISADTSKYKVFAKDKILDILDVENVHDDIMVNFETREIVSVVGIKYNGKNYYTQYKLPGGQTIIETTANRDLSFELEVSLDGLNATITANNIKIANGTLSYKRTDSEYWTSITNYTEKGREYIVNISKSGNYIFRLQDNANSENYIENTIPVTVTNKPRTQIQIEGYNYALTSENWAYAQKDNVYYVWIPRFKYKTNTQTNNTEIKFVKGNTSIATDNTYIDETWNVHSKFTTTDGIELTGIWISVGSAKQTGQNILTLLNDTSRTTLISI